MNLAPGGLYSRWSGSFYVGELPNIGFRRSFLFRYLVYPKEESSAWEIMCLFPSILETQSAGVQGKEGKRDPITQSLTKLPDLCLTFLSWTGSGHREEQPGFEGKRYGGLSASAPH